MVANNLPTVTYIYILILIEHISINSIKIGYIKLLNFQLQNINENSYLY